MGAQLAPLQRRTPLLTAGGSEHRLCIDGDLRFSFCPRAHSGGISRAAPLAGAASGLGAALLIKVFRYLGQEFVIARYPTLVDSESWRLSSAWLQRYGLFALAVIAGSPLPQTPARRSNTLSWHG